jgi:hypothetical protein
MASIWTLWPMLFQSANKLLIYISWRRMFAFYLKRFFPCNNQCPIAVSTAVNSSAGLFTSYEHHECLGNLNPRACWGTKSTRRKTNLCLGGRAENMRNGILLRRQLVRYPLHCQKLGSFLKLQLRPTFLFDWHVIFLTNLSRSVETCFRKPAIVCPVQLLVFLQSAQNPC